MKRDVFQMLRKRVLVLFALALVLMLLPDFEARALSDEDRAIGAAFFDNFDIADKVNDPSSTAYIIWSGLKDSKGNQIVHVTGRGLIDRAKWEAAARLVDERNFSGDGKYWYGYENFTFDISDEVRFPADSSGLFGDFDGALDFDKNALGKCTSQVVNASNMFYETNTFVDIAAFDMSSAENISSMFERSNTYGVKLYNFKNSDVAADSAFRAAHNMCYLEFSNLTNDMMFEGLDTAFEVRDADAGGPHRHFSADSAVDFENNRHYIIFPEGESVDGLYRLTMDYAVVAQFNEDKTELQVSGSGTIDHELWRKIPFALDIKCVMPFKTWGAEDEIEDFDIRFMPGSYIALPEDSSGLFANFDGNVIFDGVVDTSQVTDMSYLFYQMPSLDFGAAGLTLDTANVTDMTSMFDISPTFYGKTEKVPFNSPISFSDTSKVQSMQAMFADRAAFNQPLDFNTVSVTDMGDMFAGAKSFNQPLFFDTSMVTNMEAMFYQAENYNQPIKFDMSRVENVANFLRYAANYKYPIDFDLPVCSNVDNFASSSGIEELKLRAGAHQVSAEYFIYEAQALKRLEVEGLGEFRLGHFGGDCVVQNLYYDSMEYYTLEDLRVNLIMLPAKMHQLVYIEDKPTAQVEPIKLTAVDYIEIKEGQTYSLDDVGNREASVAGKTIAGTWQLSETGLTAPGDYTIDLVFTADDSKYGSARKQIRLVITAAAQNKLIIESADVVNVAVGNGYSAEDVAGKQAFYDGMRLAGTWHLSNTANRSPGQYQVDLIFTAYDSTYGTAQKQITVNIQSNGEVSLYDDVKLTDKYYPSIKLLTEKNIFNGTGNGNFAPKQSVNRAVITTVIYRVEGEPSGFIEPFNDVPAGSWYQKAVAWAFNKGVVKGYDAMTFAPLDTLTKEQIITMIYRYQKLKGKAGQVVVNLTPYSDADEVSGWAQEALTWAANVGIEIARGGVIDPQKQVTREELAYIVSFIIK